MNKRAEEFVNSKTSELNGLAPDKLTVIKWLTDFASDEVKAINYTRCCTTLKDKETISFEDLKKTLNPKELKKQILTTDIVRSNWIECEKCGVIKNRDNCVPCGCE